VERDEDLGIVCKMLAIARIVEKRPEDTLEMVNILSALIEFSMEDGEGQHLLFSQIHKKDYYAFNHTEIVYRLGFDIVSCRGY
jgi:hypothetical protein